MKALFAHMYPVFKERIEKLMSKFDFGELRFVMREFQKCTKQFWNFGKLGIHFLEVPQAIEMTTLIAQVAKLVREDKDTRLEQFQTAKKKMDEEDVDYFEEDIKKVDKIQNRKFSTLFNFI